MTNLYTFKVAAEDTNGAFTVAELFARSGPGSTPHAQLHADESFLIEGTFDFTLAGQVFSAGAGEFVYLPKALL